MHFILLTYNNILSQEKKRENCLSKWREWLKIEENKLTKSRSKLQSTRTNCLNLKNKFLLPESQSKRTDWTIQFYDLLLTLFWQSRRPLWALVHRQLKVSKPRIFSYQDTIFILYVLNLSFFFNFFLGGEVPRLKNILSYEHVSIFLTTLWTDQCTLPKLPFPKTVKKLKSVARTVSCLLPVPRDTSTCWGGGF